MTRRENEVWDFLDAVERELTGIIARAQLPRTHALQRDALATTRKVRAQLVSLTDADLAHELRSLREVVIRSFDDPERRWLARDESRLLTGYIFRFLSRNGW